ncbi:M23 family metallopeptidase [Nesterenkonia populi]|uniref:M23 family metallopeptidase n=1 Tax=Nesterenkonia populi TaxID=1591087 RepID=UPI001478604A|nr:M23 family metallopeptidase [Nesterenkonia populi]
MAEMFLARRSLLTLLLLTLLSLPATTQSSPSLHPNDWEPPLRSADIAREFAAPPAPWARGHRGLDLGAPAKAQIRSPADGVVSFSGTVVNRHVLSINHGNGYISSFEPIETDLNDGDPVSQEQPIGHLNTYDDGTHHCDSPCLHWGVRHHGQYINPMLLLGPVEPSVLLPLHETTEP